jgi:hypothetical protein
MSLPLNAALIFMAVESGVAFASTGAMLMQSKMRQKYKFNSV